MKVAWFTPFSEQSAIGEFSSHVTSALASLCDVDLWIDERKPRRTSLRTVNYGDDPSLLKSLSDYDRVIYNMGDHLGYHGAIYEASRRHPGVVILHDRVLHHMFATYYLDQRRDWWQYLAKMQQYYGAAGYIRAFDSLHGQGPRVWEVDDEVMHYPFFEDAISNAEGVVVHSAEHANMVRDRWTGPVSALRLPCYSSNLAPSWVSSNASRDRVTLVTVGCLNRNKHVDKVVEVLGRNEELARRVHYVVIGPYDRGHAHVSDLFALIERYSLGETVTVMGLVDDDILREQLRRADAFINLRYPAMEGGSASLALQLCTGKPVLVCDTGVYAEIPNDCVLKVTPGDKVTLEEQLSRLVTDESLRVSIGSKARRLAEGFTERQYATDLMQFLAGEVARWRPVLKLCDTVGSELGWMGATPQMSEVVSQAMAELFDDDGKSVESSAK